MRLEAMKELKARGFPLGLHLDPLVWTPQFPQEMRKLGEQLREANLIEKMAYVSLGVVRFPEGFEKSFAQNYPNSLILRGPLIKTFDQKSRYPRPFREALLTLTQEILLESGFQKSQIYECMENFQVEA